MQTEKRKRESVIDAKGTVLSSDELNILFDSYNSLKKSFGPNLGYSMLKKITRGLSPEQVKNDSGFQEEVFAFVYLSFKHMLGTFGEDMRLKKTVISNAEDLKKYNLSIENKLFDDQEG